MKKNYFLFLLFIACTSVRSEKSEITKMDIDCHVHVNRNSNDDMQFDPKRAQLAYKSVGFQRACLISPTFLTQNNPACWTKGGQCLEDSAWVNQTHQWLANEIKSLADGSVGLCGIDPNYKDWEQLIEFCKKIGLSGIKLHTVGAKFSLLKQENQERLTKIFNKAGELQFPVLIHSSFPSEEEASVLIRVAAASKDTKFIFAHMLGKNWRLMSQAIPNIYMDISGAVIMLRKSSKEVVDFWRTIGIDKVIFGSDWPVFHPAETIWALKQYPLTNEELDQILNSNAKPLFNH